MSSLGLIVVSSISIISQIGTTPDDLPLFNELREEEKNREKLKKSLQENSKVSGIKKADEKSYNKIEKEGEKMMDIA